MRKGILATIGIILLIIIIDFYFYPLLPEKVASHWDLSGQADGYTTKNLAILMALGVCLAVLILQIVLPLVDPLKAKIQKFQRYFDRFMVLLIVFFFYLNLLFIFWNLGYRFNFIQFLTPGFSILFFYMGILVENSKRNWFIGIRTPWTLSSDIVWDATHKVGGKLFKISALIALLGVVFPRYALLFVIGPVLATSVYTLVYSYFEFQKIKK